MAQNPAAVRSQYGDLFGPSMLPVLEELFRVEISLHPMARDVIFKTVTSDRDIYQMSEIHDMELFEELNEGQEFTFSRAKQGANQTLTIAKFGLGFSISEEAMSDGKFDLIADMIRKLGRSGRESQQISAANIFNNGFSTQVTNDGVSVFNTAHTLPSGGTFRNKLSSDADLSATSLETMLTDFETQMIGDGGQIYNMRPKWLYVHPSFKRLAKELIGSELKVNDVASDNGPTNAMNSFAQEGLTVVSDPHLTDLDAWFMVAESAETGLRLVIRRPLETQAAGSDVGFSTDSIFYKARYREILGVSHPYGIFGTSGS